MFPAVLYRFLFLGLIIGYQCLWAAVPRRTQLHLESTVSTPTSPFPIFSGDTVTFRITITHTSKSQAKAVDALLQLQIPFYLKVLNHHYGQGVPWSSVDKSETSIIKFKFNRILVSKSVTLSLIVAVDPYFAADRNDDYHVAVLVNIWYYGEDGPCARPPSLYNAQRETGRLPVKFVSTTACEKRIELQDSQYSASSVSNTGEANRASFFKPGVWMTADSLATDKNQFLHLNLSRLMRVTKIATRGRTTPSVAFVRTYHVYYSKNSVEWSAFRENNDIKLFQGNTDGKNVAFNFMPSLTHARYLRIVPKSWKRRQALDVEVFGCNVHPKDDLADYCPIFDFENGVAGWEKTGTAFDNQPTIGDNYKVRKGKSANIQGNAWIATAEDRMRSHVPAGSAQGNTPVGTLTSPNFLIVTSKFYFLVGGTVNSTDVRAELVIDGKSVRKASGDGDEMTEVTWDVKAFRGKEAVLRLVDDTAAGHLNFDAFRVDCFLDADAQEISLPSRAVVLNPRTHSFYVCDSSHLRRKDVAICRMTSGSSDRWLDTPDILGLLGVDKSTHQLYALSADRYVIRSINPAGGNWQYIKRSEWDEVKWKPSMVRMIPLPCVTLQDGAPEEVLITLLDSNGDRWKGCYSVTRTANDLQKYLHLQEQFIRIRFSHFDNYELTTLHVLNETQARIEDIEDSFFISATSHGIAFKPAARPWVEVAAWSCQVSDVPDDPCFSEPCENHANCTAISRDQYTCSCVPGYNGVNCETDIDECLNNNCVNGGTCVQGINYYFCRCPPGFTGDHCDNVLPTCRTSPCLHGGTCIDETPPSFRCACTSNYKGSYCEIEKEQCLNNPCYNDGFCVPKEGGYKCVCRYGFTGTRCNTAIKTNFEIVETKSITETNTYLVIKARIPSHGESFTESWCRDYLHLCSDGRRDPTGFGRSYNHIKEYASCQEKYQSVMDRANVLGAYPNEKVAALAQQAGFTDATSTNSFTFNACDGRKCSRILPESGCDEALSCISKSVPNREVYTVCIEPDSHYRAVEKKWSVINGVRLLMLNVKPNTAYSKHDTWCTDYEVLCDRYGLRALGIERDQDCVEKYRAIIHENVAVSHVRSRLDLSYGFLFKNCSTCGSYSYDSATYYALQNFKYYSRNFGTACTEPQGIGFKVLDDQKLASYNGKDYMAIKIQVPLNGKSNDTNWCKDYQLLCRSYNMAPLGCGKCVSKYSSSFTTCPMPSNEVEQMLHAAGFSDATSSNTFIYQSCTACSNQVIENKCQNDDLFCIDQDNHYRVFYTACVKGETTEGILQVKESRSIVFQYVPYKVLKLYDLPEDGQPLLSNWCEEYQALCKSAGGQPVGCGPSYFSDPDIATCASNYGSVMDNDGLLCGNNSVLVNMVEKAGFYGSWENTFMFHNCSPEACSTTLTYGCSVNCSCHPALGCLHNEMSQSSRESYAICSGYSSAFQVLETKDSTYDGHEVLVVKAQIPSNGVALSENWCEDYKMMCYYYGYRPTGCGVDYADDINYASCRYDYQSVMPTDNVYGCPATIKIALIAKAAGFLSATASNSFGFSDCEATCVSTLTVGGPFIDLSVTDGIVYTICATSDSHFKVMSSTKSVYKGGEYLLVQALVPHDLISKHDTWCSDYQRMCESFGLKPVAKSGRETDKDYATCRKLHGPINTRLQEATDPGAIDTFGEDFLGYSMIRYDNTFIFGKCCDTDCFHDMNEYKLRYSLEEIQGSYLPDYDYNVFTVCASSDSNFHVLSKKTITYQQEDYLVIMATLPSHRESKYENWCRDYERLCRSFRKRPTGCGLSYQWSSKYRACVDKYQSAMAENDPVGCNSSETVANIANMAGYIFANQKNSFAFHQCSNECPKILTDSCPDSLPCLSNRSDIVYTVCTDSSSAFEVERVLHTWEGNVPLLFITATLNGVVDAKSGDWCRDYQKLCASYAARPVGCYSDKQTDALSACTTDYNAVPIQSDVHRCDDDGVEDIERSRGITPHSPDGESFKYHKCKSSNCEKSLSDKCNDALNCLKESEWVYTTCSRASHNFEIIDTESTSHEELEDILVIHANIPMDGRSLYDSWCEDYTKMCSVYGKVPLACPLRPDYTAESAYRACSKDYNGYMMKADENSTLSCPLNDFISGIAQEAGFNQAFSTNTLSLTTCLSCSKTIQIINIGSYISMSCPPSGVCTPWQGTPLNRDVYMLCVKPQQVSTFHIDEIRHIKNRDRKYAAIRVSLPYGTTSLLNDWCSDYQKVCESLSMRPIACGLNSERLRSRRLCRKKYNAVMPREFDCPNYELMADIARAAGFHYDEYRVFSLNDCNKCGAEIDISEGLDRITTTDGFLYTACTYSDSNFEELRTRDVVMNDKSYFVVKAQLPVDMISSHETWCKDYQMMCESYGKRPLTCSDLADLQSSYNALLLDHNCDSLSSIPQQAGFVDATEDNTFVFKSYSKDKCSRNFPTTNGPFGRLNSSVAHRQIYTVCLSSATAFEVLARRLFQASNGRTYLFLQVAMPEDGRANYASWCHDYTQLCREYGKRPVTCGDYSCRTSYGAIHVGGHVCPLENMLSVAESAGISESTDETNFLFSFRCISHHCKKVVETRNCTARGKKIPHCFDRNVNDAEFTTVCVTPADRTRFPTLDVKYVKYSGRPYTVIRTQKTHQDSLQGNWCHDYKQLCLSFFQRPLACPTKYNTDPDLHLCQRTYSAVSMESNEQGCPMNTFVAELARHAGFPRATPQNSFAFQNCNGDHCSKQLPTSECSEALYCVNMGGDQEDLFTACTDSDSAFNVLSHKYNINYNSVSYGVIKVSVSEGYKSAHEDWCKDYQRLCESFNMEAVQCKRSGLELPSDICTNNYGAHERLQSCAADAKNIATKAKIGHVADKTALIMSGCKSCPTVVTKSCSFALDCLRSSILYAVCAMQKQVYAFKPVQTRFVNYGNRAYLLIQSYLRERYSASFKDDYDKLCRSIYGYKPIVCGRTARDSDSSNNVCYEKYENSLSHQGDDFTCPPAKTISYLAKKSGFYQAKNVNTFAFYQCSAYAYYRSYYGGYQLSTSSCYDRLWCLKYGQYHQLYYTMCGVPLPSKSLGFHVLDKKEFMFLGIKYVALKLSIGSSCESATDNWCFDYRELCRRYNMVPTGCGSEKKNDLGYFKCNSIYRSFMSHRNSVGCGKTSVPSSLVRRAGFPDAVKENTFVFNDCSQCAKKLQPATCDPALNCLHSEVFNTLAYTLCVERKSGFEYIAKKKTIYGGVEYLVVKSALPVDNRPLYDNWCVDYQKLCYSVGAFPVACSLGSGAQDLRRFAEKYGAITVDSIPCPPIAKVLAIVKKAGYSTAKAGNSFAFTGYSSYECSKNLPTQFCTPGLDCLNSQSREVFAVCVNPTNFAVSDVRTTRHSKNTFTVIQATLPASGLSKTSTWCEEYATLCRSMKQQPVVCPGYADPTQYEKCRDSYDGYLLFDKYDCNTERKRLQEISHLAGFAEANFANTFGLASCASCQRELYNGPECDPSLNCINNKTADRQVFALCMKDGKDTNFQVLATKEIMTSEVQYQVVKATVSPFGRSKYDTWCTDYERMCSSLEMRPVRCSSDGNTCPLLYKALVSSQEQFDCNNNSALVQFIHNSGFSQASQDNTFIYSACSTSENCRKTLLPNQCDGSMNCLKKPSGARVVFTLCARSRHTNFKYLHSRTHVHKGVRYFVIMAGVFSDESKSVNWCYDYRDMCLSFGKQPVVLGSFGQHFNTDRNQCFGAYNATSTMEYISTYNLAMKEIGNTQFTHCRVIYKYCKSCVKTFVHCPFDSCGCDVYSLFCL